MPLAGMAAGATRALDEIVAERLLAQKLEQEIADRQARMQLERDEFEQRKSESETAAKQRQQQLDAQDTERRARDGQRGVRRMLGDALMQGDGQITSQDRRGLAALQVEAGDAPTLLNEPKPERDPIADYRERKKIDAEFDTPDAPARPQVFQVNGKLVDANGKVVYDGGPGAGGGPSPYAQERNARTSAAVDDIIGNVSGWTAGYGGLLANVPQSEARALRGKLDTLRANIAFNELAAMREASKTGGALGSVAVRELDLLQNSLGNLDQLQEPASLIAELTKIKESAERWRQAAGGDAKAAPMQPVTSRGAATPGAPPPASAGPRRMKFDKTGKLVK
jgi:hypothetical protein